MYFATLAPLALKRLLLFVQEPSALGSNLCRDTLKRVAKELLFECVECPHGVNANPVVEQKVITIGFRIFSFVVCGHDPSPDEWVPVKKNALFSANTVKALRMAKVANGGISQHVPAERFKGTVHSAVVPEAVAPAFKGNLRQVAAGITGNGKNGCLCDHCSAFGNSPLGMAALAQAFFAELAVISAASCLFAKDWRAICAACWSNPRRIKTTRPSIKVATSNQTAASLRICFVE